MLADFADAVNLILLFIAVRVHMSDCEKGVLDTALSAFYWALPLTIFFVWPLTWPGRDLVIGVFTEALRLTSFYVFALLLTWSRKRWLTRRMKKAKSRLPEHDAQRGPKS